MNDNDRCFTVRSRRRDTLATVAVGAGYGLAFSVLTTFVVFAVTARWGHHGTALERLGCAVLTILVAVVGVVAGRRHRLPRRRD